jgi:hypothetical protein
MMAGERRMFRALGGVDTGSAVPPGEAAEALRAEFERAFALKESLQGEAEAPVSPTGRRTTADAEAKLRRWSRAWKAPAASPSGWACWILGRCGPSGRRRSGVGCTTAGTAGSRPTPSGLAVRRVRRAFPGPKPRRSGRPETPSSRRARVARERQESSALPPGG